MLLIFIKKSTTSMWTKKFFLQCWKCQAEGCVTCFFSPVSVGFTAVKFFCHLVIDKKPITQIAKKTKLFECSCHLIFLLGPPTTMIIFLVLTFKTKKYSTNNFADVQNVNAFIIRDMQQNPSGSVYCHFTYFIHKSKSNKLFHLHASHTLSMGGSWVE